MTNQNDSFVSHIANRPAWFRGVRYISDIITSALNVIGTLLIVAIMILVNADVVGRGVFGAPVSGVPEIVSMSIVAIVFLQLAHTFRMGRITRTDAMLNFIKSRSKRVYAAVELLFALAAIVLTWQLFSASKPLFVKSWMRGTFEGAIGDFTAPIWPVKLIILIGCVTLMMQLLLYSIDAAFRLCEKQSGGAS